MSKIHRLVVILAGVAGLLTAFGSAAHAHVIGNHSEPLHRGVSR